MSFIIPQKQLKEAVNKLAKIVPNSSSLPVLSMVRFNITNNTLRISATDLKQHLSFIFNNSSDSVELDQSFLIQFSKLKEYTTIIGNGRRDLYIDKINSSTVCLSVMINDKQMSKEFTIITDDDWPEMGSSRILGEKFDVRMLEAVRLAAPSAGDQNEPRKILHGVLLEPNRVVTTNGKQLATFSCNTGVKNQVVIPITKFLLLKDTATNGFIRITNNGATQTCRLTTEHWEYEIKCLEGLYPNYKQVIPKDTVNMIEFTDDDIKALQTALPLFECCDNTETVYIYSEAQQVSLLSDSFTRTQDTNASYTGNAANTIIGVNRKILLHLFKQGYSRLKFNDPISPIIGCNDSDDFIVFMPIRNGRSLEEVVTLLKQQPVVNDTVTGLQNQQPTEQPKPQPPTEGESKMNENNAIKPPAEKEPETTVNSGGFKVTPAAPPVDPFDELFNSIAAMKQSARATLDMATALQAKARAVQKHLKAKERDFKDTRDLLSKLKKVSGF